MGSTARDGVEHDAAALVGNLYGKPKPSLLGGRSWLRRVLAVAVDSCDASDQRYIQRGPLTLEPQNDWAAILSGKQVAYFDS